MSARLLRRWYDRRPAPWLLRPAAWLFRAIAAVRRIRQRRFARDNRMPVPVIVVGNLTVGGTGKTPTVIWLVRLLREWGWRPGVVGRGYGGRARTWPQRVRPDSDPAVVGDEPVLIARACACPVVVGPDRVAATRHLVAKREVDVVVSDDGLQHYRLWRDMEIVVVDGSRGLGNGQLLPAGPLREPPSRLVEVDLIVVNGGRWRPDAAAAPWIGMDLALGDARALDGEAARPLRTFASGPVHAVAGIGNPDRFFSALSRQSIEIVMHPFPDHHPFVPGDLDFGDDLPVLMTEKDAVKCKAFAAGHRWWSVPASPQVDVDGLGRMQELTERLAR